MFKKRIALAVISAMATGYRRAGFALEKGTNELEVTEAQCKAFEADPNLTVSVLDADLNVSNFDTDTESESIKIVNNEGLLNENTLLKSQVAQLTAQCSEHEQSILLLEKELANQPTYTHEDTLADLAGIDDFSADLDVSSAPEELHHWIAVIDDINKETPLTKKPNCDHLTITVEGEPITPSAAERDAAWEWYQNNVVIAAVNSNTSTEDTGE